jgi:hypothetical protein
MASVMSAVFRRHGDDIIEELADLLLIKTMGD